MISINIKWHCSKCTATVTSELRSEPYNVAIISLLQGDMDRAKLKHDEAVAKAEITCTGTPLLQELSVSDG